MQDFDAKLGIFSNKTILVDRLETKFKDKYLDVVIFDNLDKIDLSKFNYLIINLLSKKIDSNKIKKMLSEIKCKVIVLLPLFVKPEEKYVLDMMIQDFIELNPNLGIILAPELLGNGVEFNPINISHDLIMQSLLSERIKINNNGLLINTISLSKLGDVILKEIFSFGISGQILALIGPRSGAKNFLTKYLGVDEQNIIPTKMGAISVELEHSITLKNYFSLSLAIKATRDTFLSTINEKENLQYKLNDINKEIPRKRIKIKNYNLLFKRLLNILLLILSFLSLPLIILIISAVLLYTSSRFVLTDATKAQQFVNYSLKLVTLSKNLTYGIPFYNNYSNILYKTASLFNNGLELTKTGNEFVTKILGDMNYNLPLYTNNISALLDRIHTDSGFLQSDIEGLNDFSGMEIREFLSKSKLDINNYKNKIYFLKMLTSRLSILLGVDKPMKYLILFQNNMELRPTGGFIGSFAIVSFDKGRLTEIVVNDIYSADGQLKGHIDPPEPIREYLSEGGWYMRDANWDPDFVKSATTLEWFLDKEINSQVDGIFAIDLSFVESILKTIGSIKLVDYGKTITAENLYLTTQEEIESEFFPGSIKKTSFMTSLAKSLISEFETVKSDKYFALFKEISSSLEERHLQLFFHDANSQDAIDKLGYSGRVDMSTDCGIRCFDDKYSLIDANLGVNKSNLFIERSQEINLAVSKQNISHELLVTYNNVANQAVGNPGVYKSYTRLILPIQSKVTSARLYDTYGNSEDLKYDIHEAEGRKELGFLINLIPSSSKKIQIVWDIEDENLTNGGEFRFLVRKQAGTKGDKLAIQVQKTDLTLTGRALSSYNTFLVRDFKTKLFFTP